MTAHAWIPLRRSRCIAFFATAILCAYLLCIAGCGQPEERDLKSGISEESQMQIMKSLEDAGITGAEIEAVQDRGDHWDVLLSTFNEKSKLAGPQTDSKKPKRAAPGEGLDSVPTFTVYKDGRVVLPPALQKK